MAFESWDEAMLWHGSLIGYMAGVKSACNDEDKSSLLLRMADTQAKLELMESENAKLRELATLNWEWAHSCCGNNCKLQTEGCGYQIDRECNYEREIYDRMRELGIEVDA